jgi:hypothetical protein
MAFASEKICEMTVNHKQVVIGQYTQISGDTGGDIVTGLDTIGQFFAQNVKTYDTQTTAGTATIVTDDPGTSVTGIFVAVEG